MTYSANKKIYILKNKIIEYVILICLKIIVAFKDKFAINQFIKVEINSRKKSRSFDFKRYQEILVSKQSHSPKM